MSHKGYVNMSDSRLLHEIVARPLPHKWSGQSIDTLNRKEVLKKPSLTRPATPIRLAIR